MRSQEPTASIPQLTNAREFRMRVNFEKGLATKPARLFQIESSVLPALHVALSVSTARRNAGRVVETRGPCLLRPSRSLLLGSNSAEAGEVGEPAAVERRHRGQRRTARRIGTAPHRAWSRAGLQRKFMRTRASTCAYENMGKKCTKFRPQRRLFALTCDFVILSGSHLFPAFRLQIDKTTGEKLGQAAFTRQRINQRRRQTVSKAGGTRWNQKRNAPSGVLRKAQRQSSPCSPSREAAGAYYSPAVAGLSSTNRSAEYQTPVFTGVYFLR